MTVEDGKVKTDGLDERDFGFLMMRIENYMYQRNQYLSLYGKKLESMNPANCDSLIDRHSVLFD